MSFDWLARWAAVPALVMVIFVGAAVPAQADYETAKLHFEGLPPDRQFAIALGVTATGDFQGLIDYGFTKRMFRAIVAFQSRQGYPASGILSADEVRQLERISGEFLNKIGAQFVRHPRLSAELLVPLALFDTRNTTDHGLAYERNDKNLSLSFVAYANSEKTFTELYATMTSSAKSRTIEYKTLHDDYFVSNGTYRGRYFYTWMSRIPGGTTGFTLSWSPEWHDLGGKLSILLANSFAPSGTNNAPGTDSGAVDSTPPPEQPPPQPQPQPPSPPPPPQLSTGTGFVVSNVGHLLTNNHVAGSCKVLRVHVPNDVAVEANVVARDEANDLALIKAVKPVGTAVASFRARQAPSTGTDIVVYGYPLSGILSASGNVVTGNITANAGIGNDSRFYQISAPVQPGNSGGPVFDRQGTVVGIVTGRLSPAADSPQNVNFAIKSNIAENFLDSAGLLYGKSANQAELDTPSLAALAQKMTFLVECSN